LAAEAVGSTGLLARRRGLLHRHAQSPIQTLDGEPCFEGRAMRNQLRSNARVKADIVEVYSFVLETCNEGIHNIQCVGKAQFAEYPRDWLKLCEAKMGPQPTNAVAVCTYAQQVVEGAVGQDLDGVKAHEFTTATTTTTTGGASPRRR